MGSVPGTKKRTENDLIKQTLNVLSRDDEWCVVCDSCV